MYEFDDLEEYDEEMLNQELDSLDMEEFFDEMDYDKY